MSSCQPSAFSWDPTLLVLAQCLPFWCFCGLTLGVQFPYAESGSSYQLIPLLWDRELIALGFCYSAHQSDALVWHLLDALVWQQLNERTYLATAYATKLTEAALGLR